jgi:glutathione peroxidase
MSIQETELVMLNGTVSSFSQFAGKVVLVVNVASRCGLAPQYEALEALQQKYGSRGFTVLGMPSNQFLQELKKSEDIAEYCSTTWGVSFPMTEKIKVNGKDRHPLYKQLVKARDQSGVAGPVAWNFEKFLILPNGEVHRFRPKVKPDATEIVAVIEANLPN